MEALPGELPFSITLKPFNPEEVTQLPYIDPHSPLALQLSPDYVDELNRLGKGDDVVYRYYAESDQTLQWGIFVREPGADQRLIGLTALARLGRLTPPETHTVIADPMYHNRGIAKRVYPMRSLAAWEAGVEHLVACIREDNAPSLHVSRLMGFVAVAATQPEADHRYIYSHQLLDPEVLDDPVEYALRMRSTFMPYSARISGRALFWGRMATLAMLNQAATHLGTSLT